MAITINTDIQLASGPKIGLAVVNGVVCLTIEISGQVAPIPIQRPELAKLMQIGQASLPLFDKISLT